jgi:hypothetical protein
MERLRMNGLKRATSMLVVMSGISLGIWTAPATTVVTSGEHPRSPDVFHCC